MVLTDGRTGTVALSIRLRGTSSLLCSEETEWGMPCWPRYSVDVTVGDHLSALLLLRFRQGSNIPPIF